MRYFLNKEKIIEMFVGALLNKYQPRKAIVLY